MSMPSPVSDSMFACEKVLFALFFTCPLAPTPPPPSPLSAPSTAVVSE